VGRNEPQIASASDVLSELPPAPRSNAPVPPRKPGGAETATAPVLTVADAGTLSATDKAPAPILKTDSRLSSPTAAPAVSEARPADPVAVKKAIGERLASLNSTLQNSHLSEILGQGDYDVEQAKRIETGMLAIAAHTGQTLSAPKGPILRAGSQLEKPVALASFAPPLLQKDTEAGSPAETWAIQIGAFTSRVATDQAIKRTLGQMPRQYASASPIIVPLRTQDGWLFRGRLSGFESKDAATAACTAIKDCIPVAPYE
jgi:hypothetical protein